MSNSMQPYQGSRSSLYSYVFILRL